MSFGEEARLTVHPLCGYPSFDPASFTDDDWKARYIVKAVKHDREALERAFIVLGKPARKFNHENYGELVGAYHRWAAEKLKELGFADPVIVAVPNSSAVLNTPKPYPTQQAAEGIARAFGPGASAYTGVRFTEALPKAHQGGSRNKYELLDKMTLLTPPPAGALVLFDDVCSSGSHLFAVQRLLAEHGDIDTAIVCGRTVHFSPPAVLKMPAEELVTYW